MKGCSSGNNWQYIRRETLQSYFKLLHYHQEAGQVHLLPWCSGPNTIFYENNTYFLKIADHHLLHRSPKIECINGPLVTYVKNINGTYFPLLRVSCWWYCLQVAILSNYLNSWLQQPAADSFLQPAGTSYNVRIFFRLSECYARAKVVFTFLMIKRTIALPNCYNP